MLVGDIEIPTASVLEVEGVKPEIMELVLKFMYTGKVKLPENEVFLTDLLGAAEKYELTGLKTICLLKMFATLSDENAGAFAVAIHQYNASVELKCLVMDYCQKYL